MKPKRAALYARCSTREQTTDPQLDRLRAYATTSGLQVVEEYVDHGQSGRKWTGALPSTPCCAMHDVGASMRSAP